LCAAARRRAARSETARLIILTSSMLRMRAVHRSAIFTASPQELFLLRLDTGSDVCRCSQPFILRTSSARTERLRGSEAKRKTLAPLFLKRKKEEVSCRHDNSYMEQKLGSLYDLY
jgi:hypothetical protein